MIRRAASTGELHAPRLFRFIQKKLFCYLGPLGASELALKLNALKRREDELEENIRVREDELLQRYRLMEQVRGVGVLLGDLHALGPPPHTHAHTQKTHAHTHTRAHTGSP